MRFNFVKQLKTGLLAAAAVAMAFQGSQAAADGISVNFANTTSGTATFVGGLTAAGPIAGNVAGFVPQAYWNSLQAPGQAGGTLPNAGTGTLVDSSGVANSLTVTSIGITGDTWNTTGSLDNQIFGDWFHVGTGDTLDLGSISYTNYDLILYTGGFNSNVGSYTIGGSTTLNYDQTTGGGTGQTPVFVNAGSYVTFAGLSGTSQNITFTNGGITGFQIVDTTPIPEPTSLALLGLGSVGMLFRRRRTA